MLLRLFLNNVWLAVGSWAILFCSDYILTLKAARLYRAGASSHFLFAGGYELTPYFKEDIARLRKFSFRFFLILLLNTGLLLILYSLRLPELFAFGWGALVCVQAAVHFRHVRNLALFHYASDSRGIAGKIEYEHWLSLRLSAVEMASFTIFLLLLFLLWGDFFFLGGAIACLSIALRHLKNSGKKGGRVPQ